MPKPSIIPTAHGIKPKPLKTAEKKSYRSGPCCLLQAVLLPPLTLSTIRPPALQADSLLSEPPGKPMAQQNHLQFPYHLPSGICRKSTPYLVHLPKPFLSHFSLPNSNSFFTFQHRFF